jgi:hypothetical protein
VGAETCRQKSLRIGVHLANAVVWGPVYRTRLIDDDDDDDDDARRSRRTFAGGDSRRPNPSA